jgi:GLPGLI family protein
MKTIRISFACLTIFISNMLFAQTHFVTDGTIEFEKSVNAYAAFKKQIDKSNEAYLNPMLDQYKKTQPQFKILKSNLSFSKEKTLFEPLEDTEKPTFISNLADVQQNNIVFTDLNAGSSINQKLVFGESFLVKDNARKIKWKITNETRDIAGYSCRRANGIMLDSIYVVAFYTIAIPVSGGPEQFSGLPGMILGVALPHENVSWFATKVNVKDVPPLKIPVKGKVINNKELQSTIETALRNRVPPAQLQLIMKSYLL